MGQFLKNIKLTNGVDRKNKFDLDSVHITTNDFFYMKPAFSREVVAKEDIQVDMSCFSRATPLLKPAYADVKIVNRAFFVPYRSVYPQFNYMLTESRFEDGNIYTGVPYIKPLDIYEMYAMDASGDFTHGESTPFLAEWSTSSQVYDISVSDNGTMKYLNFKPLGKQLWSIFTSLGYNLPTMLDNNSPILQIQQISALPLLSFLRIWSDWFRPTAVEVAVSFYPTAQAGAKDTYRVEHFFAHETWATAKLSRPQLYAIANWLTMIPYERDYFTSATLNPYGVSTSQSTSMFEPGSTASSVESQSGSMFNPTIKQNVLSDQTTNYTVLRQWTLEALRGFTKWMHNNKIAGYRMLDRYMAQYGLKLNSDSLERSIYLGNMEQDVRIADVTSMANTYDPTTETGSLVGDYTGKGTSDSQFARGGHFKYSANEFGQFIIVSQVVPKVSYYQGLKREMMHFGRFEFYNDKFDGLGYQAIANFELATTKDLFDGKFTLQMDGVYGYTDRYAEYKQSTNQDVLDGDFRVRRAGANTYKDMHLFRELNPESLDLATSRTNLIASWSAGQFDRIFANQNAMYDHFLTYYSFRVQCWKPMRRLFEDFLPEPGESRVDVHEGGSQF